MNQDSFYEANSKIRDGRLNVQKSLSQLGFKEPKNKKYEPNLKNQKRNSLTRTCKRSFAI